MTPDPRYALAFAALIALAGCDKKPADPPASTPTPKTTTSDAAPAASTTLAADAAHAEDGIAWQRGDVDAAFAQARAENKPVFMYWGAVWCPPCNQVKATIFNRQDFIEQSRFFVPVYIDGDAPNAQAMGTRFKVSGYPTMVLFRPDGSEVVRLPGEVEPEQYMKVLTAGIASTHPIKSTLDTALKGGQLSPDDWRLLAYYSFDTDDQQLVPKGKLPETLAKLAAACPGDRAPESAARLSLKALATTSTDKTRKAPLDAATRETALARLKTVLADKSATRETFDLLVWYADGMADAVAPAGTPERAPLIAAWDQALQVLEQDTTLSTLDRIGAVEARVGLARLDAKDGPLPPALVADVRTQVAAADQAAKTGYQRQSVISEAADVLAEAGLLDESDAMLTAELKRSHSPYYFMLGLAGNARKRGDTTAEVDWRRKAWDASEGGATRLQWGVGYLTSVIKYHPDDAATIEATTQKLLSELEPVPATFEGRSARSIDRLGAQVVQWSDTYKQPAALKSARAKLDSVCKQLPKGDPRASCDVAFKPKVEKAGKSA